MINRIQIQTESVHIELVLKLKLNLSSGKKKKMNSHRIKRNLHRMFKITNKCHVPNNFGRKCILAE